MKKILIIDTSAIMYRAHFAMSNLVNSKGFFVGASFGFVKQLELAINEVKPCYIAAAYDIKRENLSRSKIFEGYKQNRKAMPDELKEQIDIIKNIVDGYNIPSFSALEHEADDVIATIAKFATQNGIEAHIFTGDKDIQQLVNDDEKIHIHLLGKNIVIKNRNEVKEYIGVYPEQITDYFGLNGDKSDGIPGVDGIGEKKGRELIEKYDNLENIYENIENIKGKMKENLIRDKENAFLSRELAKLELNVDLDLNLEKLEYMPKSKEKLFEIYKEMEFNSFIKDLDMKRENFEYTELGYEEFKKNISKYKKIALYKFKEYISFSDGEHNFLCKLEDENNLFSSDKDLSNITLNGETIIYDAKSYMHDNLKLNDFFDILVAAYIINTESKLEIEDIIEKYADVYVKKYDKKTLKKASEDEIKEKTAKISYGIFKSYSNIKEELQKIDVKKTYENIEKPLIKVLYNMEKRGIKISLDKFKALEAKYTGLVEELEQKIYELSNCEFNIDSPRQLANVLFNEMEIEVVKKNKNSYSTDASVLEYLSDNEVEIAKYILEYRAYKKLLSTYIQPLPEFADFNDKIHTSFNATGTATGRLSSSSPNLQNIPTRTEDGQLIRSCFIASKGKKLVSFDYSQIELRILAQLSKDDNLIEAYKKDLDLHKLTAQKIFNKEEINKYERNIAKTINFSVLYGKTPFGLSKELKISMKEAKEYIDRYFEEYEKVPEFIDKILEKAKQNNYVETLFGTRRYIRDINSSNKLLYEQAKRMAINTVVQGTAANIIKKVMLELNKEKYNLLLQVHDELIFEIEENKVEEYVEEIKKIMENTIIFDDIKLKVNYVIADTWGDLK